MTLIDSPRLSNRDRQAWHDRARYDHALAQAADWTRRESRARTIIRDFAAQGPCYSSTSWGKDSTCVAYLTATCGLKLPLVYIRMRQWESPECLDVRDAFLAEYGDMVDYHEYFVDGGVRWWQAKDTSAFKGSHNRVVQDQFAEAKAAFGIRHISGVRGEESRMRRMAMARWGESGPNACRPIGRWSAVDVFAFLERHHLPVHPAYAMSLGGELDRRWLRVSPIGGISNADKIRSGWESHYYPDIVGKETEQ